MVTISDPSRKSVSDLIRNLERSYVCPGVKPTEAYYDLFPYVIPKASGDPMFEDHGSSCPHWFLKSRNCSVLLKEKDLLCDSCPKYSHRAKLSQIAKKKKLDRPAHINSLISQQPPSRFKLALQMHRLKCENLERQLKEMHTEIQKSSIEVDHELSKDIITVFGQTDNVTPFMSFFWQQHKKALL